jgi:F-type H+-transporting ATPase subunit delta
MAENVTIARPYADAAFQLARGAGALGPWSEALDRLAAVAADSSMKACFSDPNLSAEQLSSARVGGAEQQNFVRVLVDNERLQVLPEIRDLFVELKNGHEGVRRPKSPPPSRSTMPR